MSSRLLSIILIVFACLTLASSEGQDIQSRLEKSLSDARSLSHFQIDWLDTYTITDPAQLKAMGVSRFSRTFQYSYIESGPKFRAVCKLVSGTQTNLMKLYALAFDGQSYCTYYGDNGYMTKSSEMAEVDNSESSDNPLTAPFMFLSRHSDACPSCMLRFKDITSDEFAKGLALPMGETSNGLLEISMQGLPLGNRPTAWRIAINETGESFTPNAITLDVPGSKLEMIYRLLEYTNLGAYQFPRRIEWTMGSYPPTSPPTLLSTGTVTVISARIPNQIADSVFELESEQKLAGFVWDLDQQKFLKARAAEASVPCQNKGWQGGVGLAHQTNSVDHSK